MLVDSNGGHRAAGRAGGARGHRDHPRPAHPPPLGPRRRTSRSWPSASASRCSPTSWPPSCSRARSTETIDDGDVIESGELRIEVIHTPGPLRRPPRADRRRHRLPHRRRDLQGHGRRHAGARRDRVRGPQELDHGQADEAAARDARSIPGTASRRRSATEWERTRSSAIWRGLDEEGSEPARSARADAEERERGDAGALGARLRRRQQGLGPLRRTAATRSSAARRSSGPRLRGPAAPWCNG